MSQKNEIMSYLKRGNSITTRYAMLNMGIGRLQARISELKQAGQPIITNMVTKGDVTYAEYKLITKVS